MDINTSKNLGGVGAILLFLAVLPYANYFGILGLIGLILVLVALKGFADFYRERGIFNNALYAVAAAIVGIVIFGVVLFYSLFELLTLIGWTGDWAALSQIDPTTISSILTLEMVLPLISQLLIALVILFAFALVTAILFRKSLKLISARTGVGLFGTTGLLMLIGAVLAIIAIGFLLIWISFILLAVAFFSVRTTQPPPAATAPPPPTY